MIETLKKNKIFSALPDAALQEMVNALRKRTLAAGEVLFNMGDEGKEMVIVNQGRVAIYIPLKNNPAEGQPFRYFNPGEMLGEMALIDQLPRSASARAVHETTVLLLDEQAFLAMIRKHPEAGRAVMAELSGRTRYTTNFLEKVRQWVQRIAEGNYEEVETLTGQEEDSQLSSLAADFARMASTVREREETLKKEVAKLQVQIDEKKRKEDFEQITGSDYYLNLKAKLKAMREDDD